jgi:phospholipid/cholesterol/gamma-HCH transport system ATP-binding protein
MTGRGGIDRPGRGADPGSSAPPKIRIRGLCKAFGPQPVLAGLDLDIAAGETLALLGASGSGKTLLVKCIIGLVEPDAGSIEIDGRDVLRLGRFEREALARRMGVLFQNGALFDSLPVWQNVAFAILQQGGTSEDQARRRALDALQSVALGGEVADLLPSALSGGMQKRVALARAIVTQPEMLFLDSPTDGLDPITTAVIDQMIVELVRRVDVTAVIITHDLASARRVATRAALLHEGRIAWGGPIEALDRSENPLVERFLRGSGAGAGTALPAAIDATSG